MSPLAFPLPHTHQPHQAAKPLPTQANVHVRVRVLPTNPAHPYIVCIRSPPPQNPPNAPHSTSTAHRHKGHPHPNIPHDPAHEPAALQRALFPLQQLVEGRARSGGGRGWGGRDRRVAARDGGGSGEGGARDDDGEGALEVVCCYVYYGCKNLNLGY